MIKSMTGFASVTRDDHAASVSVTVKSVNHRFLDLQLRIPGALAPLEIPAGLITAIIGAPYFLYLLMRTT